MKQYKINIDEIDDASASGIVVCWSDEYDCPVVAVSAISSKLFGDRDVVEISEGEES